MAIHFNGNSNPEADATVNDTGAQQNQNTGSGNNNSQQQRPADGGSGQWGTYGKIDGLTGFSAVKAALSPAYSGGAGNIVATKLMARLKEREQAARENNRPTLDGVKFFLVDQDLMDVDYSGIVVAFPYVLDTGEKVVSVHTLIIEDNEDPAPPAEFPGPNGVVYYVPQTPGDSYNSVYYERVRSIVRSSFDPNVYHYVDAHASVVYTEVNPDNDIEVDEILRYVANALIGSISLSTGRNGDEGLIQFINENRGALKASLALQPGANVRQPDGLMARSDYAVTTSVENLDGRKGRNRKGQLQLSTVSGFVDLTYIEPDPLSLQPVVDAMGRLIPPPPPKYYQATAIITNISSPNRQTISTVFTGLANATILSENSLFLELFRPQRGVKGDMDIRDIGAVGYDLPFLTEDKKRRKIDTKSKEFIDNQGFERLVTSIISPKLAFAIDIPEVGPLSWMLVLLRDAAGARGEAIRLQAQNQIVQICNSLSNGRFSSYYHNESIIESAHRRVILGVFTEAETQRKVDLRTVDYLAILNEFGTLEDAVLLYDKAANDTREPDAKRIHDMVGLLSEAVFNSHDIRVRGYAQRMFFTGAFIKAFTTAMRESGCAATFSNLPMSQQELFRTRADRFANYAVDGTQLGAFRQPGSFTSGQNNQSAGLSGPHQRDWTNFRM